MGVRQGIVLVSGTYLSLFCFVLQQKYEKKEKKKTYKMNVLHGTHTSLAVSKKEKKNMKKIERRQFCIHSKPSP